MTRPYIRRKPYVPHNKMSFEEKLASYWAQVRKTDGCWLWIGSLNHDGYGNLALNLLGQQHWRSHRFAWALANGPIPKGMQILHSCDVPACVNPAHLRLGTIQENAKDRNAKLRMARGERNGAAKITADAVRAIRASDEPPSVLGERYGVHPAHISKIRLGHKWKHIQ